MNEFEQIEQKYGFVLPDDYRSMQAQGWFDFAPPDHPNYFWLPDAEWMPLSEIAEYEPEDYQKPGFAPFATTAGGDHWCWWPAEHPEVVVLCPHDFELGDFYAPSFIGFIYRQLLDHARYVPSADEQEVRQYLRDTAVRLAAYLPDLWKETLNTIASTQLICQFLPNGREAGPGLVTEEQYQAIIQRDLAFPLLDQEFQWMYPLTEEEEETAAIWRKVILDSGPNVPFAEKLAQVEAEKARRSIKA